MVKVEVNKETAWQNRLFLVGKIANPALSFVRLLASAICNQEPAEGPQMWLGFVLIDVGQNFQFLAIVWAPQPQFVKMILASKLDGGNGPLTPRFHRPYYLILARPRLWKDFILRQGHNPRLNQIQLRQSCIKLCHSA